MAETRRLNELARSAGVSFPEGALAVALSGGADSAAVAWLACESGAEVRAIHVDHGLPASGLMEDAALAIASTLGIEIEVRRVELERPSEGEAREKRRAALLGALLPGEWLVTGHTADDQAETVMMKLLRGSGVAGLSGMRRLDRPIARPIMGMWRSEARELASLAGLPFSDDPVNEDLRHFRNRIRLRLLPQIEGEFNPAFRRILVRNAEVLAMDMAVVERLRRGVRMETRPGGVRLVVGELAAAGPAVASAAVRRALTVVRPPHPPSAAEVDAVLAIVGGDARGAGLSGGVVASRNGPWLTIELEDPGHVMVPVDLQVPGVTRTGGFLFDVSITDARPLVPLSRWAFVAGAESRLTVLPAAEGGVVAGKKAMTALAEAGIPAHRRALWPVVHTAGEAVWIPGVRRAGWPGGDHGRYLCAVATEDAGWEPSEP